MPKEPTEPFALDAPTLKGILSEVLGAVQQNQLTPDLIRAIADSTAEAARKATAATPYPHVSHLNPLGDLEHPRPEIVGEVYWVGARLDKDQLTREEIDLVNHLSPGEYWFDGNDGTRILFRCINLEPSGSNKRRLMCLFPCVDSDSRQNLPPMRRMLKDVVSQYATV